jgi:Fe-S-cluster containining protein
MTGEIDYKPYFKKYEALVGLADNAFARVVSEGGDLVKCKSGCSDCCHALFDLTLVEAIYINYRFLDAFAGKKKEEILERANSADRKIYKIKRQAHKALMNGENEVKILADVGAERVRCPLLNEEEMCELYQYRPITCRIYGIPTVIQGMSHTCGKSGFVEGVRYPTVNMDTIYKKLYEISTEFVAFIQSKHLKMADILVPVSMALITDYDDEYLGVSDGKEEKGDNDV